jgi:hypothetical protein
MDAAPMKKSYTIRITALFMSANGLELVADWDEDKGLFSVGVGNADIGIVDPLLTNISAQQLKTYRPQNFCPFIFDLRAALHKNYHPHDYDLASVENIARWAYKIAAGVR